ncbi:lipoprotein insertase outer membrane protein LolB [Alkalisalibacterium limincola]|uniref:Outer-membrane lipoprotein LolB n=1 Tax=Alkalisalibacterium limincola TaxID=2699169 RepID=A0A5C8KZE8_9GAMM|nr:lipoprotein insertase outer membrane protein LolB [Alkalisalibacterium limincola]TXK65143.1 outer membrane lipoprotein LolB [Alkalisalibacterium limincola]
MNPHLRLALSLLPLMLLLACVRAPVRIDADDALLAGQQVREATLERQGAWTLVGRIAVSDGQDGGSGRIQWAQDGERFDIRLSAPVSRQSWRLSGQPGAARLEGLEGGPLDGPDAEALLYEATGWLIPLADMARWARGMRGDGVARVSFDERGLPSLIEQAGWAIEYRDWVDAGDPRLPRRVFAERGQARVRLQVERWEATGG